MNLGRCIGEGIIAALLLGLCSKRSPRLRPCVFGICIILETASVVSLYMGQENSEIFFWHPYIMLSVLNLSDYALYRRGCGSGADIAFEKLLLWPVFVLPVMSGFILTAGWLIKLYHRNILALFHH